MSNAEKAIQIANAFENDISDRCGLDNEWDLIDESTQDEIRKEWTDMIQEILDKDSESPHLWVRIDELDNLNDRNSSTHDATIHLTLESAQKLSEQLRWFMDNHYQVKS